jgi:hypothetical protein
MSEELKDEEISIVCMMGKGTEDERHFVINEIGSIAKYMNLTNVLNGKLTTTENSYVLHFPKTKTKTRHEILVRINRYSGKIEWEHGEPPFGEMNPKNVFSLGVCSQEGKKKF